jgi:AcrR family transcriptional regulator
MNETTTGSPDEGRMPRGQRRKQETRRRLMDAARRVMARKGVEAAAIAEIAEEADVGFGSFYNHFSTKEEVAAAVVARDSEELGRKLDELTAPLEDPALVVAVSTYIAMKRVREDELWGWFMVKAVWSVPEMRQTLGSRMLRDVMRGVEAGRFDLPRGQILAAELAALMTLSAIRLGLEGRMPAGGDVITIEVLLRMLGFDRKAARDFAREVPAHAERLLKDAAARGGPTPLERSSDDSASATARQPVDPEIGRRRRQLARKLGPRRQSPSTS